MRVWARRRTGIQAHKRMGMLAYTQPCSGARAHPEVHIDFHKKIRPCALVHARAYCTLVYVFICCRTEVAVVWRPQWQEDTASQRVVLFALAVAE